MNFLSVLYSRSDITGILIILYIAYAMFFSGRYKAIFQKVAFLRDDISPEREQALIERAFSSDMKVFHAACGLATGLLCIIIRFFLNSFPILPFLIAAVMFLLLYLKNQFHFSNILRKVSEIRKRGNESLVEAMVEKVADDFTDTSRDKELMKKVMVYESTGAALKAIPGTAHYVIWGIIFVIIPMAGFAILQSL